MTFEIDKLDIVFTENLPKDIKAEMDWFISSGGRLSQETMLSQLTFIENAQDEMDRLDEEDPQRQQGKNMYSLTNYEGEVIEDEIVEEDEINELVLKHAIRCKGR